LPRPETFAGTSETRRKSSTERDEDARLYRRARTRNVRGR
jgi:hypothetical protein